jgi:hypothetical protein
MNSGGPSNSHLDNAGKQVLPTPMAEAPEDLLQYRHNVFRNAKRLLALVATHLMVL